MSWSSRSWKRFSTAACQSSCGDQLPGSALAVDPAGATADRTGVDVRPRHILTGVCESSRRLNSPTAGDLPHHHGALPISAAQTAAAGLTWSDPLTGAASPDGSIDHCGGDAGSGERTRGCFTILAREGLGRAENDPGQFLITPQRHAC